MQLKVQSISTFSFYAAIEKEMSEQMYLFHVHFMLYALSYDRVLLNTTLHGALYDIYL